VLVNLWYVAEWSHAVTDKPVRAKVLGRNLALFRDDSGNVHCLADTCIHRGGALGRGWVKDNCLVCPYHGWRYGADGKCTFVPSEGEDYSISPRARVDSYPVEERYGMIWVFLGDLDEKERYPIPPFPEFGNPEWKALQAEFTWNAEAARVVENGIDVAHAAFVHPMFGIPEAADKAEILRMEKHEWWATSDTKTIAPKLKGDGGLRRFIRKDNTETITHPTWYLPGYTVRLHVEVTPKMHIIMFDANTPVDEHTTRTFAVQLRSFFKADIFDGNSKKRLLKIFQEDAAIVEKSRPYFLPETLMDEVSVSSDRFMATFRLARKRLIEEKGWAIDTKAIEAAGDKKVFTIPSPARKAAEAEGIKWALPAVPLVPATKTPLASVKEQEAG
jgi:phenylpropionate dioxygenase-like ring-hydroxylating dioxygenase large terminal subunit